jgi:hypothetical protein
LNLTTNQRLCPYKEYHLCLRNVTGIQPASE